MAKGSRVSVPVTQKETETGRQSGRLPPLQCGLDEFVSKTTQQESERHHAGTSLKSTQLCAVPSNVVRELDLDTSHSLILGTIEGGGSGEKDKQGEATSARGLPREKEQRDHARYLLSQLPESR